MSAFVKAAAAEPYEGQPVFRGLWRRRVCDPWKAVSNANGDPIAYMTEADALNAAWYSIATTL